MEKRYDYAVLGSGPAGHVSAITAAKLGLKTVMIERDLAMLGGVCLNEGCIPAKSLYAAAHDLKAAKKYFSCQISEEDKKRALASMVAASRSATETLKRGLLSHLKQLGVDIIEGAGVFENDHELKITSREGKSEAVYAENILISTGSSPKALTEIPFDGKCVISSSEAVKISGVPENILIVGAGAIGVEFASFFSVMGSRVTLVEEQSAVLPGEDKDVSSAMRNMLKKMGARIFTSSTVRGARKNGDKAVAGIFDGEEKLNEDVYDAVLVSVGRSPLTEALTLSKAGVKKNERGFIPVNGLMQTNISNIYAAGDVVPGAMLAHTAQAEGEAAAFSAAGKARVPLDRSSMPRAVYSEVQAASVGSTEEQARAFDADIAIGKSFFKANGKAVAVGEDAGFVKVIADAKTRVLLGAHIVGYLASEMINEFVLAKSSGLTIDDIARSVHAHPTFSESAASAVRDITFR
jgi:dihydrolipoamide dehydrogenase